MTAAAVTLWLVAIGMDGPIRCASRPEDGAASGAMAGDRGQQPRCLYDGLSEAGICGAGPCISSLAAQRQT